MRSYLPLLLAAGILALPGITAFAQNKLAQNNPSDGGKVIQTIPPPVSQNVVPPPLSLSDDQRTKIRQVLKSKNTEVTFALKSTQSARNFNPEVGAKLPPSLKPYALPPPLIYEMPKLKQYTYLKLKGQVLIVNPMTGKIVDIFPET